MKAIALFAIALSVSVFTATAQAGDLNFRSVSAQEGSENYTLQISLAATAVHGNEEDESYPRQSSNFDSVDLYNYVRVTPATKFSISTQANGFLLVGDFKPETNYKITLKAGLKSKEGARLTKDETQEVTTQSFSERLTFKSKSRYLPGSMKGSLAWEAVNVSKVEFEVRQVFPQNIHQWVTSGQSANEYVSEKIKTITQKVNGKKNRVTSGSLSLNDLDTLGQGIFVITATRPAAKKDESQSVGSDGEEEGGEEDDYSDRRHRYAKQLDSTTVVVTNLTVVAKKGEQEAKVWVMNTQDLSPIKNASIDLISTSNRKLDTCNMSAAKEECLLKWKRLEETQPYALIVRAGKDLTYVRFEDLTLPNDAFHAGKREYTAGAGKMDAFIHSERDLYRPGETVRLAAMIRNNGFEAVAKLPIRWTITSPRGKIVRESVSETSEMGLAQTEFPTSPASDTGKYVIAVYSGPNLLHETHILVEEFVPERIGLKVTPFSEVVVGKSSVPLNITALYLFGPPVAKGSYKLACSMKPAFREIPNRPGFATGIYNKETPLPLTLAAREGSLNDKGVANEKCDFDTKTTKLSEAFEVKAKVEVSEAGSGRATTKSSQAYVASTDTLVGLKMEGSSGRTIRVSGGMFDFKGQPKAGKTTLKVKLFNLREHWYYTYGGYDSWKVEEMISPTGIDKTVEVSGNSFQFTVDAPEGWGRWLVRAVDSKTGYTADLDTGHLGWYYSEQGGGKPPEPSALKVELSKKEVSAGEKINVLVDAPFSGRLLFAFETNRAIETRWVEVKKAGAVKIDWKVPDVLPNVYVTALLLKDPREAGGKRFIPARAWGASSVAVIPSQHRLDVTAKHPEISESRKEVVISFANSAKVATEYDVAVVDEGILQMTDYKSPDPLKRFFEPRSMGVSSIETMGWTVAVEGTGGKNPGGDKAGENGNKNMPVRLVSFWYPGVKSDANGAARISVPLPAFQGKVRIMAVAAGKARMGASSTSMTVRDPLVLLPTLPRFMTQGDKFSFPVSITNLSGKDQTVSLEVDAGPMVTLSTLKQSLVIPNGQAKVALFNAEVKGVSGVAKIGVKASAGSLISTDSFEIPVKPAGIEQTIRLSLDPQKEVTLASQLPKEWRGDFAKIEATVSAMPYLNQLSQMDELLVYPYGCIEQTTSATMPLLVMQDLLPWLDSKRAKNANIKDMVNRGIRRVLSMQTGSGGFGYWPGDGQPDPWGSAYATHMLIDAKKLGYDVPAGALKSALDYLENFARNTNYKLTNTNRYDGKEAEPFAIYVLAKGGRAVTQELRESVRNIKPQMGKAWTGISGENYFLLTSAARLLNDKESIKALSDESVYSALLVGEREDHYTYWSALRSDGLRLSVLEDLQPNHAAVETLAQRVAAQLGQKNSYYFSTQEIAWAVLGLGKRLKGIKKPEAADFAKVGLMVNGKKIAKSFEVQGSPGFAFDGPGLNTAKIQVSDAPKQNGVYLYLKVSGYTKSPPVSKSTLSVQRVFRKRDGSGLDPRSIKQGDTVFVELTVQNTGPRAIKNLAIVDRVPAGFEIDNPRLGKSEDLSWMKEPFKAEYQDLRDDRLQVFGDLNAGQSASIYYSVRAVTKGSFTAPASLIEAMYDPENFDYDTDTAVQVGDALKK